jgi:hypothetical protein
LPDLAVTDCNDDGIAVFSGLMFNLLGNLVRFDDKTKELPNLAGSMTAPWHTVLFSIDGTEKFISRHGFRLLEVRKVVLADSSAWFRSRWSS